MKNGSTSAGRESGGKKTGAVKAFLGSLCLKSFIALVYILLLYRTLGCCPLRAVTGLPCPACGMTGAYIAVLHGDWPTAFSRHPLWWLAPPLWFLVCLEEPRLAPAWARLRRCALTAIALAFAARWLVGIL